MQNFETGFDTISAAFYVALTRQKTEHGEAGFLLTDKDTGEKKRIENVSMFVPYSATAVDMYSKDFSGKESFTLRVDGEIENAVIGEKKRVSLHLHGMRPHCSDAWETLSPYGLKDVPAEMPSPQAENDIVVFFAAAQALAIQKKAGYYLQISCKLQSYYQAADKKGKVDPTKKPSPNFRFDVLAQFADGAKLHISHIWTKREKDSEEKASFAPRLLSLFDSARAAVGNSKFTNDGDSLPF